MKFRDHPQLTYKGLRSWPPDWVDVAKFSGKVIGAELGVLTDVRMRGLGSCRVFLTMEHDGVSFIGVIFFDDQPFCVRVYEFLRTCIGKSIKDIGEMEFQ